VSSENPDFLQACRLRTRLLLMMEVGDQSLTNAKVYFQQRAISQTPGLFAALRCGQLASIKQLRVTQ
jgi:hypothetical protein